MGFIVAKTFLYLALPPAGLFIIMAAGFFLIRSRPRLGKSLIGSGFILLYLMSTEPVSHGLMRPLEAGAAPLTNEQVRADAIVVLGGGVIDLAWVDRPASPSNAALARLIKGIALHRKFRLPLVLMGGNGDAYRTLTPDADAMAAVATEAGVPEKDIIRENRSRNTIEGARALSGLIKGKRIILVTSASHMLRAAAMFEKNGYQVVKASTDFVAEKRNLSFASFIPKANWLGISANACSEYLSLAWYRLTGQI